MTLFHFKRSGCLVNTYYICTLTLSTRAKNTYLTKSCLQNEKAQLIHSLQTHKVNTLTELRRIEKVFASANAIDTTEPMANAWVHYVDSNNLLSELRGLTKQFPFSSECLDEAKRQVIGDSSSTRGSNFCWLVLTKIRQE